MARERLLALTRDDFEWEYFRAGGNGGQNQNKTSSGVRVRHRASGAVEESREARDQKTNRQLAFAKISENEKFRLWLRVTAARIDGIPTPEERVEEMTTPDKLKIEVKDERGRWTTTGAEALASVGVRESHVGDED